MPRTITEQRYLMMALNNSRETLQRGMETVKGYADENLLKFCDIETDLIHWSIDDRLVFDFNLTTTSIFSTQNAEYESTPIQDILEYITRGIEAYAWWHHLRYDEVIVARMHWYKYDRFVVTYETR